MVVIVGVLHFSGWSQPLPGDTGINSTNGHPVGGGAPLDSALVVFCIAILIYILIKYYHSIWQKIRLKFMN